jgi:hypothetical protein
LARELPVHKPANLIAMVRRADSTGLKAILEIDEEYGLSGKDVVSKPFEITFATDAAGKPLPAQVLLRIVSPEFNPAMQEKKILIRAQRDSTVCSFLLTPLEPGHLTVQLELYIEEACVASRILRANGVPSGRPVTIHGHQVITMPLSVNVSATEFENILKAAAAAPGQVAAPPPAPRRPESMKTPVLPSPQASPPPKRSSAVWWKAGVAAALVLICVPIIHFQIAVQRSAGGPQSIELPSVSQPEPTKPSVKNPKPAPRPGNEQTASPKPTRPQQPAPVIAVPPQQAPEPAPQQPAKPAPAQPEKETALRLNRERLTILRARANSASAELLRIKKQLAEKGLALRADVLDAERQMKLNLDEANAASRAGEAERMKRSLDAAERAIQRLEKFLGQDRG